MYYRGREFVERDAGCLALLPCLFVERDRLTDSWYLVVAFLHFRVNVMELTRYIGG